MDTHNTHLSEQQVQKKKNITPWQLIRALVLTLLLVGDIIAASWMIIGGPALAHNTTAIGSDDITQCHIPSPSADPTSAVITHILGSSSGYKFTIFAQSNATPTQVPANPNGNPTPGTANPNGNLQQVGTLTIILLFCRSDSTASSGGAGLSANTGAAFARFAYQADPNSKIPTPQISGSCTIQGYDASPNGHGAAIPGDAIPTPGATTTSSSGTTTTTPNPYNPGCLTPLISTSTGGQPLDTQVVTSSKGLDETWNATWMFNSTGNATSTVTNPTTTNTQQIQFFCAAQGNTQGSTPATQCSTPYVTVSHPTQESATSDFATPVAGGTLPGFTGTPPAAATPGITGTPTATTPSDNGDDGDDNGTPEANDTPDADDGASTPAAGAGTSISSPGASTNIAP